MVTLSFKKISALSCFLFLLIFSISAESASPPESHYPITQSELQTSIFEIEKLVRDGAWLEAKARYQTLLQYDLLEKDRSALQSALEDLNLKTLFSPLESPDSFLYTVKEGDSLYEIAKEHNTTIELIKKSNRLDSDLIRPETKLKISKAIYEITVDKSDNKLALFSNGELFKTYAVATGSEERTPVGTFTIENKLVNPVWYKAGAILPPESPDNILGTRWLGFSLQGYGIHGTTIPESIGKHSTEGCVRMYNRDVEELYLILPLKTKVTIVE